MSDDRITIRDLRVPARIGVTDAERAQPQSLLIDLDLEVDTRTAGASDDLDDTVDYDRLTTDVAGVVRSSQTRLLESLAEKIAARVCTLKPVERVTVEIRKESPPVSEDVGRIAVRITRP